MKKTIIIALLAVAILCGGWYYASPGMTLSGMRDAAQSGDYQALNDYVDFPAVRENLKSDLADHIRQKAQQSKDDPMALGIAIATPLVASMVDNMVTPEGIMGLAMMGKLSPDARDIAAEADSQDFSIHRMGLNEFHVIHDTDSEAPVMVFTRHGLGWKLSQIDISNSNIDI